MAGRGQDLAQTTGNRKGIRDSCRYNLVKEQMQAAGATVLRNRQTYGLLGCTNRNSFPLMFVTKILEGRVVVYKILFFVVARNLKVEGRSQCF